MNVFGEMRSYPELPSELRAQLRNVPVSGGFYHPCDVTLRDGRTVERVYVVPAERYITEWGVWPEEDQAKSQIDLSDVAGLLDSRSRLPTKFANELYHAGESGMGYTIFTVKFKDGSSLATYTGNAVDFIRYPEGQTPETVRKVIPHLGRDDPSLSAGPDYHWCLYSD
jgi:hypothetical protein